MDGWELKILFDGQCPMCRREIAWLRRRDTFGRLRFVDIADPAFDATRFGLDLASVHAVLHGVLPDGRVVKGMEVIRRAYRAVGWGWMWAPTGWPVLRGVFDAVYAVWARRRLRWTG
ncbi:MAG: thiol-disulfide oxidoreductase DCC family protein, partial [Planctomycetota bacterium]